MPITRCETCGRDQHWSWDDAFDKFGFDDGNGQVETERVARVLAAAGYEVAIQPWGCHNIIINGIWQNGVSLMPDERSPYTLGYDNPRNYLPPEIVALLDKALPESEVLP